MLDAVSVRLGKRRGGGGGKLAVEVDCVVALVIAEFNVALHEADRVDETSDRGDDTASVRNQFTA